MAERNETSGDAAVQAEPATPAYVLGLAAVAMVLVASQVKLPFAGGRIAVADLAMGAAFAAVLLHLWRDRRTVRLPTAVPAFLALYCVVNLVAGAGLDGAVECAQRIAQLLCGVVVMSLLFAVRPHWLPALLGIGLLANLLVAAVQAGKYGFGFWLPPADVLALKYGFGRAFSGLFRSRTALAYYLGLALVLSQPYWLARWRGRGGLLGILVATVLVLGFVAHGQLLVLIGIALVLLGLLHSRQATWLNLAALVIVVLTLGVGGASRPRVLRETLSPFKAGMPKQAHVEVVAAMRLAASRPFTGIGAGKYQSLIGTFYGELPNPNENDIETDTQAGIGILLGTAGFVAGSAFVLLLLSGLVQALRRYCGANGRQPAHLAAAAGCGVLLGGMLVSDPLVRGLGWFPALALTLAFCVPAAAGAGGITGVRDLSWRGVVGWGGVLAVLLGIMALRSGRGYGAVAGAGPAAVPVPAPVPALVDADARPIVAANMDFFRVLGVAQAKQIAAPAVQMKDSHAANGLVVRIPDGVGKPADAGPDLKYGGAIFEIEVPLKTKCNIWVRTWWEGSCGNSVFLRVGSDAKPVVVGNDGTYDAWHWLKAPGEFELDEGPCEITIMNREDGVRFDQILVTGDLLYVPQGIEEE